VSRLVDSQLNKYGTVAVRQVSWYISLDSSLLNSGRDDRLAAIQLGRYRILLIIRLFTSSARQNYEACYIYSLFKNYDDFLCSEQQRTAWESTSF
jgi:hypothetical protein